MELDRSWKDQLDNRVNENVKNHIKVLKTEMDIMGEKILEKDEKTGNRRGPVHTALWVLKDRIDELEQIEDELDDPSLRYRSQNVSENS